jgi:hypothetical protein
VGPHVESVDLLPRPELRLGLGDRRELARSREVGGAGSMAHVLVLIAKDPISLAFQSFNSD